MNEIEFPAMLGQELQGIGLDEIEKISWLRLVIDPDDAPEPGTAVANGRPARAAEKVKKNGTAKPTRELI